MIDFLLSIFKLKRYKMVFVVKTEDDVLTFTVDEIFRYDFDYNLKDKVYKVFKKTEFFENINVWNSIECFVYDNTKKYERFIYDFSFDFFRNIDNYMLLQQIKKMR